jgi:hypothetical protein
MDKFLGRTLGVAALLAGAGVFYHYVIYLPGKDREQKAEKAAAAASIQEEAQNRANIYRECLNSARLSYDLNWANACKETASTKARELKNCLADRSITGNQFLGSRWCHANYGDGDASSDCSLPSNQADGVNKYYADAKKQCEIDSKVGT